MHQELRQHCTTLATLTSVLALLVVGSTSGTTGGGDLLSPWTASVGSMYSLTARSARTYPNTPEYRTAFRLQRRLRKGNRQAAPSLSKLANAVSQRQELLQKRSTVTIATEESQEHLTWDVSTARYPQWIGARFSLTEASFYLNADRIAETLEGEQVIQVEKPVDAVLKQVTWSDDEEIASRAVVNGTARPGYVVNHNEIARAIATALEAETEDVTIELPRVYGKIVYEHEGKTLRLDHWASGKSNYIGSTKNRQANVQKALTEHVNNTVVPPGGTFSFNSTLDGPVTLSRGWKMAKVIFNGGDLEPAPGGGICQASTTVYRAIINAGFPVVERRSHSLYVSYYRKYGVGIDATIYPGSQDLVFQNDTENPLVIQAYNDGYDATVSIYGVPDGREVALAGPYFKANAPEGFTYRGRNLDNHEVAWIQRVTFLNGEEKNNIIVSRYQTIPQSIVLQHMPEEPTVHTSASGKEDG